MIGYVYSPGTRLLKAVLDKVSDFYMEDLANGAGEMQFYAPLSYAADVDEDDIVWFGGSKAGVVEGITLSKDTEGAKTLCVYGHTAEIYLDRRIVCPALQLMGSVSGICRALLTYNLISPSDPSRKISFISLYSQQESIGTSLSYQQTGGNLLKEVSALCQKNSLRFALEFDPTQVEFVFRLYPSTNRSVNQSTNSRVIISSALDDILSSSYQSSTSGYKNVAYVAGEGSGDDRKYAIVNPGSVSGYSRRELFVDARDLQTVVNGETLNDDVYIASLVDRGVKKLEGNKRSQEFSATIVQHPSAYELGVDYQLGDTVTIVDSDLNVTVDAMVTAVITAISRGRTTTTILFGYGIPTINQKLKELM